jgi:hypothetical protein
MGGLSLRSVDGDNEETMNRIPNWLLFAMAVAVVFVLGLMMLVVLVGG